MEHFCIKKIIITICVQNINFPFEFYWIDIQFIVELIIL